MIGALILVALIMGVLRYKMSLRQPQLIFAGSFALLPFVVFNQQVITGRSIQPFHYEVTDMDQTEIMKIVSCFYSLAAKVNNK